VGREIKRVAEGFDWPLGKRWKGFLPPDDGKVECVLCILDDRSTGYSRLGMSLYSLATRNPERPHARKHLMHPSDREHIPFVEKMASVGFLQALGHFPARPLVSQDQEDLDRQDKTFLAALRKWHNDRDSCPGSDVYSWGGTLTNQREVVYDLMLVIADALGVTMDDIFFCPACGSEGKVVADSDQHHIYNAWEEEEPPAGSWWQVWETVSEGSPVTPAFATDDELIDYLVKNGDLWSQRRRNDRGPDADPPPSRKAATNFVKGSGWVASASGPRGGPMTMGIQQAEDYGDSSGSG
jgi:hypothetical protein